MPPPTPTRNFGRLGRGAGAGVSPGQSNYSHQPLCIARLRLRAREGKRRGCAERTGGRTAGCSRVVVQCVSTVRKSKSLARSFAESNMALRHFSPHAPGRGVVLQAEQHVTRGILHPRRNFPSLRVFPPLSLPQIRSGKKSKDEQGDGV